MHRCVVTISKFAEKQLRKIPAQIRENLYIWAKSVEIRGIGEVRKLKGYHDEPLKGKRQGQRSIRLNRAYRAIYEESQNGEVTLVGVLEVNKHDY